MQSNLFESFTITIPGQFIDDKKYYQYDDFDPSNETSPTDLETTNKANALIRYKHLERKLSELCTVTYYTIKFGTAGTASTIPTDAEIVVGYISLEPFISTLETAPSEDSKPQAAALVLKGIVESAFAYDVTEFGEVQYTYTKALNDLVPDTEMYKECVSKYLTSTASTPAVTVVYNQL